MPRASPHVRIESRPAQVKLLTDSASCAAMGRARRRRPPSRCSLSIDRRWSSARQDHHHMDGTIETDSSDCEQTEQPLYECKRKRYKANGCKKNLLICPLQWPLSLTRTNKILPFTAQGLETVQCMDASRVRFSVPSKTPQTEPETRTRALASTTQTESSQWQGHCRASLRWSLLAGLTTLAGASLQTDLHKLGINECGNKQVRPSDKHRGHAHRCTVHSIDQCRGSTATLEASPSVFCNAM